MAIGGVFMTDTDGNIGTSVSQRSEKISGMLFDVPTLPSSPAGVATGVFEITSVKDAETAGLTEANIGAIPMYHIKQFYNRIGGSATLYLAFRTIATTGDDRWKVLSDMQAAANGQIGQFGIWTTKEVWTPASEGSTSYGIASFVSDINTKMVSLANDEYAPASTIIFGNTSRVGTITGDSASITLSMIPNCRAEGLRYVSIALGQANSSDVHTMQNAAANQATTTPVGDMGLMLAVLTQAHVGQNIGDVGSFNVASSFNNGKIELGFGTVTKTTSEGTTTYTVTNFTAYETLSRQQRDALDTAGYIFPVRYAGNSGVYFNDDMTCAPAISDYRNIRSNRAMNKSRRLVRANLLPFVNAPFKVDPTTGYLGAASAALIGNAVTDALNLMVTAGEISAIGSVTVPATQNVLQTNRVDLDYTFIPLGSAKEIHVTEGLTLKA